MRLIAFTIELGDGPKAEQLASVAAAANGPEVSVVTSDIGATIIGPPVAVTDASVAAAHAARDSGAQIRCRVEPLGEATTECAQEVAAAVRKGVAAPPSTQSVIEGSVTPDAGDPADAPTADGSTRLPAALLDASAADPLASAAPLLAAIAARTPTPGGGSATAAAGAMAASLVVMAARVALADERYADVHADMEGWMTKADTLADELHALVRTDADAYEAYMKARALPGSTEAEDAVRREALAPAAMAACEAPLEVMRCGLSVLELCSRVARRGSRSTRPDVAVAATIAGAATRGAWINVRVNLPAIRDLETRSRLSAEAGTIARQADETERHTLRASEVDDR